MKIAFVTEGYYFGKVQRSHPNLRVDLAWQVLLESDHFPFQHYEEVKGYDYVFVIWPKGDVLLNAEGVELINPRHPKLATEVLKNCTNIFETLSKNNSRICYVQEGPVSFMNDYPLDIQINLLNIIRQSDLVFCHNEIDARYYKGLRFDEPYLDDRIHVIKSVMVTSELEKNWSPSFIDRKGTMIGGNFCNWYGGMNSYLVALQFDQEIFAPTMHNKRSEEDQLVTSLPYMQWTDWIKELSKMKYAVHMMPTVAAGTFALNCAYLGIPCIGNKNVDTQRDLFYELSVDPFDLEAAIDIARWIKKDPEYLHHMTETAKDIYHAEYSEEVWKKNMFNILEK